MPRIDPPHRPHPEHGAVPVTDIVPAEPAWNPPTHPAPRNMTAAERMRQNADLVKLLAPQIQAHHILVDGDKRYVKVGGGIAVAQGLGYAITVSDVKYDRESDDVPFYSATASLIDAATGTIVATADGYVGLDESRWSEAALYARRSMTQTRAVAKLCRVNFGAMYVLLGATSDTPAEEILDGQPIRKPAQAPRSAPIPAAKGSRSLTVVEVVVDKTGTGAKGKWTRYKATFAEGIRATTFNEAIVKALKTAMETGYMADVVLTETKYGHEIKEARTSNVPIVDEADDSAKSHDEEIPV